MSKNRRRHANEERAWNPFGRLQLEEKKCNTLCRTGFLIIVTSSEKTKRKHVNSQPPMSFGSTLPIVLPISTTLG
jgi:hypothetical protein